jgi:hypothetical protein
MPKKKILEDIKPISRSPRRAPASTEIPVHVVKSLPREVAYEPSAPRGSSRYGLWYVAIACIIGFLFSLSFLFERASVSVTPKSVPLVLDSSDTFTAQKDTRDPETVSFTVMTLPGDQSIKLPSTQSKEESKPATGRVILYNTYSTAAYSLVKSTRLQTQDGRIYRINTGVTIPGYTKSGTTVVPGSVEVSVTADVAGEASNIENADFTIPGLAGSAQATKIFGRTKTPITGGLSGTIYSIPAEAANAALGTLKEKLEASLVAKAKAQVPEGYLFYSGATVFVADEAVEAPYSTEQEVPLALHGTLTAYLIKEDTLVAAIAARAVSQYAGEEVMVPELANLTLSSSTALSPKTDVAFTFTLSGSAKLVWAVDPDQIKELFAGKKKAEFNALLSSVPAVERAEVVLKPFWKRSFPTDAERIGVTIEKP